MSDTSVKASDPAKYSPLSWELCPPELLCMIFKNLNSKALLACMAVSKRWKDIVMDYIECHKLWEKMVLEEMVNKGGTFRRKSKLNDKGILINSKLWNSVSIAQIEVYYTYDSEDFIKMRVYKDNLILLMDNDINYFDIKEKELRTYNDSSINLADYYENEYMAVILEQFEGNEADLRLYGKSNPDDTSFNESFMYIMNGILLFKLEDNICYIITNKYIVWALIWHKETWQVRLKGRYYGSAYDTICAMHVSNKTISMVTKSGLILCEDPNSKKFDKAQNFRTQLWPNNAKHCVLFSLSEIVVSVVGGSHRIEAYHDSQLKRTTVLCADMTCATEHGEVLLIGYKDGAVAICLLKDLKNNQNKPQRLLQIQDFDRDVTDTAILGLEVYEDKMSHHLFVAVEDKVIQLLITYPNTVKQYYE
ncbi:uncharacterized protein LOC110380572 [Helicoverpa armigera]|uniref:uncharacterized protein LOC110380572 n=1 Tax=Helicoverpa armigera TaxID=29058 RepID=UPI0030832B5B